MRRLLFSLVLLLALPAQAADITITVPDAAVAELQTLCEEIRLRYRVRTSDWTNALCAQTLVRIGATDVRRRVTRRSFNQSVNSAVATDVESFHTDFPFGFTPAVCGDGTLDGEFGETCDDGNNIDGDGCSASCEVE